MGKKDRMKFGLDSLFADNNNEDEVKTDETEASGDIGAADSGLMTVRISTVEPDRKQPRKEFDEEKLSELAENIALMGVLQPLLVRPAEAKGRYTIVAGERRWRAARMAGLTEVPVIVREMSDIEAAQVALIENVQREDLNPIEEAQGYKRLIKEFGMTQDEIAKAVGKSRSAISNLIRLLELPNNVLLNIKDKKLSVGHAKVLCGLDEPIMSIVYNKAVMTGMSVREMEDFAKRLMTPGATFDVDELGEKKIKRQKKQSHSGDDIKLIEYGLSFREEYGIEPEFNVRADKSVVMKISFRDKDELAEFMKKLS